MIMCLIVNDLCELTKKRDNLNDAILLVSDLLGIYFVKHIDDGKSVFYSVKIKSLSHIFLKSKDESKICETIYFAE